MLKCTSWAFIFTLLRGDPVVLPSEEPRIADLIGLHPREGRELVRRGIPCRQDMTHLDAPGDERVPRNPSTRQPRFAESLAGLRSPPRPGTWM